MNRSERLEISDYRGFRLTGNNANGTYESDQTLEHIEETHLSIYELLYKLLKELLVFMNSINTA